MERRIKKKKRAKRKIKKKKELAGAKQSIKSEVPFFINPSFNNEPIVM